MGGAIATQVGNDDTIASRREQRGNIDEAVNVIRPAVEKDYGWTVGRSGFGVSNVEKTSFDLLKWSERCIRSAA